MQYQSSCATRPPPECLPDLGPDAVADKVEAGEVDEASERPMRPLVPDIVVPQVEAGERHEVFI
jgi:hypothetical protein